MYCESKHIYVGPSTLSLSPFLRTCRPNRSATNFRILIYQNIFTYNIYQTTKLYVVPSIFLLAVHGPSFSRIRLNMYLIFRFTYLFSFMLHHFITRYPCSYYSIELLSFLRDCIEDMNSQSLSLLYHWNFLSGRLYLMRFFQHINL